MVQEKKPLAAAQLRPHQLTVEGRAHFAATGVVRMRRCDETIAAMETDCGILTVQGRGLTVRKVSLETGEVLLEGQVESIVYTQPAAVKTLWQRLFG